MSSSVQSNLLVIVVKIGYILHRELLFHWLFLTLGSKFHFVLIKGSTLFINFFFHYFIFICELSILFSHISPRKIPKFHVISRCGNFVKRHSFARNSPETMPFHKNCHTWKLGEILVFCRMSRNNCFSKRIYRTNIRLL